MTAKSCATNSCAMELSTREGGLAVPCENAGQCHEISGVPWINTARHQIQDTPLQHQRPHAYRAVLRSAICRPTWRASSGFAGIPTTAIDPTLTTASPTVPALVGSRSPLIPTAAARTYASSAIGKSASSEPSAASPTTSVILRNSFRISAWCRSRCFTTCSLRSSEET